MHDANTIENEGLKALKNVLLSIIFNLLRSEYISFYERNEEL
jgi:hypothetical protein